MRGRLSPARFYAILGGMKLKVFFAVLACKLSRVAIRLLGRGGTDFPGRIALKLCPNLLGELAKNVTTVIVTGTNGKTTTSRMIEQSWADAGISYFANKSGANLLSGVTAEFAMHASLFGKCRYTHALIESDEAAFKAISTFVDAKAVVVTNVLRDQLDRYGEVTHTLDNIRIGIENSKNATLCVNADDSLCTSLHASVECKERNRDPLTTNLVVADKSRTEKTICLAVSPSLKSYGIPGRPRLFEVVQKVKEANNTRRWKALNRTFTGSSDDSTELNANPALEIDYIVAPPRMAYYLEYSTKIYSVYLKYIAPEDIFPYSIDEVFIDATNYLNTYQMTARELAMTMIQDVLKTTGITATAGIGTNMYLCKIAMDIVAKHIEPDKDGVRIAELDEMSYRRQLWNHRPLTDFWRVGKGYAKKLEEHGLFTMGDIARCSIGKSNELYNEELLYKLFGINAELLIDHAWGYEPCTMEQVKAYKPETNSVCSGQVLHCPYDYEKAKLIVKEMTDQMVLDLVDKGFVTDQLVLTIGYDIENLSNPNLKYQYKGEVTIDRYGRKVPKHAHGTANLEKKTSSTRLITNAVMDLYDRIVDEHLLVRRITITANKLVDEKSVKQEDEYQQLDLFTDYEAQRKKQAEEEEKLERERRMQEAMLSIKKKFGKNAVLKGMNLEEGATAKDRNEQIGGHKA